MEPRRVGLGGLVGRDERVDVAPLLRPHVAEQVRGDHPVGIHHLRPLAYPQLPVAMLTGSVGSATLEGVRDSTGVLVFRGVPYAAPPVGDLRFEPSAEGVRITGELFNLPPGVHGIHFHATGKCDSPGFETADGHFNPAGREHGLENAPEAVQRERVPLHLAQRDCTQLVVADSP